MKRYAVIQEEFEEIRFEHLKQVLVQHGGVANADAARAARKNQGVLSERLTLEQAGQVCRALKALGYAVRAMPAEKLPEAKKGRKTCWLELKDDYIVMPHGTTGKVNNVPWQSVFVISSGQLAETHERRTESVSYRAGRYTPPQVEYDVEKYSTLTHATELIGIATTGRYIHARLPAQQMNYGRILGADIVEKGFFEKYLTMLDVLTTRCTNALVSPETRELLSVRKQQYNSRQGDHEYAEERKFSHYNRWLLQLAVMRLAEASAQGEQ